MGNITMKDKITSFLWMIREYILIITNLGEGVRFASYGLFSDNQRRFTVYSSRYTVKEKTLISITAIKTVYWGFNFYDDQ